MGAPAGDGIVTTHPFPYDFSGQVAVITGGARGFGLSFAEALCQRGATTVIADIDEGAGTAVRDALRADGGRAEYVRLDVRDPAGHRAVADAALAAGGRLDIWINNAGIARHGASESLTPEAWTASLDIMLTGTFFGAQAAGRVMLDQNSGTIINITSVNGRLAQAGRAAYAAAKAGDIRLTEVLAAEWGPRGVRVNAVAPAVFLTDLVRSSLADGSASMDAYLHRSPTRRLGEVPELVSTVLFLASQYSDYIMGQTLLVDGAWTADHYL
jgi:NAD(P)-dependent dehydrogenase (short-subunit alcohol dehydrogenase family)